MVKKTDPLDSLIGEAGAKKKVNADDLLGQLLGDREIRDSRKKRLLAEMESLLDRIEVEESDEPEETIMLDLAPCQGLGIMHVGINYLHGGRYTVPASVARDLREIQNRGHSHEASITKSETKGRRRMNLDVHTPLQIRNPATGSIMSF